MSSSATVVPSSTEGKVVVDVERQSSTFGEPSALQPSMEEDWTTTPTWWGDIYMAPPPSKLSREKSNNYSGTMEELDKILLTEGPSNYTKLELEPMKVVDTSVDVERRDTKDNANAVDE